MRLLEMGRIFNSVVRTPSTSVLCAPLLLSSHENITQTTRRHIDRSQYWKTIDLIKSSLDLIDIGNITIELTEKNRYRGLDCYRLEKVDNNR